MQRVMLEVGSCDHSEYDSFVCCVSSHGNQKGIFGSDCTLLQRRAFIDPIKSCTTLIDKPKLFFFQACRIVPKATTDAPVLFDPIPTPSLHSDSDILIANPSTEGNPAYSSPQMGSWFARAIKTKLTDPQLVCKYTLQQLLESVTDHVSNTSGQLDSGEVVNQCVEVTTRMRKGVKFF